MSHMVMFRSAEGKPGYHQTEALDDAIKFVERLRNTENVTEARIFRMQEVPIEFKTYYRVEVGAAASAEPVADAPSADAVEAKSEVEGEPAAAGGGRFGRFGK